MKGVSESMRFHPCLGGGFLLMNQNLSYLCFCRQPLTILVRVSIAVMRHPDHSNFYEGKYLIGAGLQFRVLVHYHYGMTWWWREGRFVAEEGAESSTS